MQRIALALYVAGMGFAAETIYYLSLVPLMPATPAAPDGKTEANYKGLGSDGLHPDASGYQIWADAMAPLLTKFLGGGP